MIEQKLSLYRLYLNNGSEIKCNTSSNSGNDRYSLLIQVFENNKS